MHIVKEIFKNDRNLKIIPIVLSLVVIALSCFNIYINYPIPRLDVGIFPYNAAESVTVSSYGFISSSNVTTPKEIVPQETTYTANANRHVLFYTLPYEVFNSGKGTAYNVRVTLTGEPSELFKVISTNVYVGEPLQSNLLKTTRNGYVMGLLGSGKGYVFEFNVEVHTNEQGNFVSGKFVLTVSSDNAGTLIRYFMVEV